MANWVQNVIIADEETIKKIVAFMKTDETQIDFNKLIPEPVNEENYDWWTWRNENWNTKWNASEITVKDTQIWFITAWNGVEKLMKMLSEKTETNFAYLFSDEGNVANSMLTYIEKGKETAKTEGDEDGIGALFHIYAWGIGIEEWLNNLADGKIYHFL